MRPGADGGGCFPSGRHYPGIAHLLDVAAVGLAEELGGRTAVSELPIVAIDTETTGRDPGLDRIIELACVVRRNGHTERHGWLINPGIPIPEDATKVHGIKDEDVRDKPTFQELVDEILRVVEGCVPLAYNAGFDRSFIREELRRCGALDRPGLPAMTRDDVEWLDPLVWAREIQKDDGSKSLGEVCQRLGIDIGQAHRATDDAAAALAVLLAFSSDPRLPAFYAAFVREQRRLARLFEIQRQHWRNRAPSAS